MSTTTKHNLFSKKYDNFTVCSSNNTYEPASKIINIDLNNIPYPLFTKNYTVLSKDESTQLSKYIANIMHLLDAKDVCDKDGVAYIAELFALKCSNIKLGIEINESIKEIEGLQPNNPLVGLAYEMSGCNNDSYF